MSVVYRRGRIFPSDKTKRSRGRLRINKISSSGSRVLLYSQQVFSRSSLSGVSQIAESKTCVRRCLWIMLLGACVLGFCYHATTYFALYAAYPTTVDVRVENQGVLEFPGVTICNSNRLRRSEYCKEYYCNTYYSDPGYDDYWRMNKSERIRLGHHKRNLLASCKFNGRMEMDPKECLKHFRLFHNPDYGNCYTFNAEWNNPERKLLYAYESDMWNKPTELVIDVDVETDEYLDDHRTPSVLVYVHDPRYYPDFGSESVKARTGHFYSLGMRKTTTKLLPLPYQTNCTDYSKTPWAQRNKGLLIPKMCTQECSRTLQLKSCNCISSNLTLVYEDIFCEGKKALCAESVEKNTTDYCRTLCRVPCERKVFEASVDSSLWPRKRQMFTLPSWSHRNLSDIRKNLVRIKLYLRTMEHTTYEHQPKYQLVEVFGHLGAYLSLWLGFSVLAFCELVEMVAVVIIRIINFKTSEYKRTEDQIEPRLKRELI